MVGPPAIVLLCVALAAPAFAFVARAKHTVVVRKTAQGAVSATCPRGEHASFGGVVAQFSAPPGSGAYMFPTGMRRTANDRWTVYGKNESDLVGSRLTSIAYCDHGAVPRVASKTVSLPGLRSGSVIATCPAGTFVVGGGFNSGAAPKHLAALAHLNRLSPTQWIVTMINLFPAATTITAIAYCSASTAITTVSNILKVAARRSGTVRVSCPAGLSVVFGGLLASSAASAGHLGFALPFSWNAASNTQWVVSGYNIGDQPAYITAIVYCR